MHSKSKHPTVVMDLTDDDEFTSCKVCQAHLRSYNNTSLSKTDDVDNAYTRHLLSHGHLNCEKCGLFIEIHPRQYPNDEALIFVCSHALPHKHCLCYECGLLYGLKPDKHQKNILSQLQYQNSTQPTASTEIAPQAQSASLLAAHGLASINVATNGTLIADILSGSVPADASDAGLGDDGPVSSEPSLNSLLPLLLVWLGIYVSSPFLFRLTGLAAWFSAFYVLLRYADGTPSVQRAVFSLSGLAPLALALYLLLKPWRSTVAADVKSALQFGGVFVACVYMVFCWSPVACVAEVEHFLTLSLGQRLIALFIALSVGSFSVLLLKNCNFMLWSFLQHCVEEAPLAKDLHEMDAALGLELELAPAAESALCVESAAADLVVEPVGPVACPTPSAKPKASKTRVPAAHVARKKAKKSKKRRRRRKRAD